MWRELLSQQQKSTPGSHEVSEIPAAFNNHIGKSNKSWGMEQNIQKVLPQQQRGKYPKLNILLLFVVQSLSHAQLFCNVMDWSPPGFSVHDIFRQEYWWWWPFPSPGDLPNPWIEPMTPWQLNSLPLNLQESPYFLHNTLLRPEMSKQFSRFNDIPNSSRISVGIKSYPSPNKLKFTVPGV